MLLLVEDEEKLKKRQFFQNAQIAAYIHIYILILIYMHTTYQIPAPTQKDIQAIMQFQLKAPGTLYSL